MTTPPASVPLDATLEEAARHMADARVGALPAVEDDHVAGVITDRHLVVRAMARGLSLQVRVEALMSTDPITVEADTPFPAAMHAMGTIDARHLPVVDNGRLVGMISFDDLFWFFTGQRVVKGDHPTSRPPSRKLGHSTHFAHSPHARD
ncbi:CBS domain-containing protein [Streptomyces sp. NEAU-S7GS2]|uniref:CBS domain-containing protein n=1 Tax=Streptomyces sp. NEAU-S7GS2 TaxID=2202000 RepID=UPI0013A59D0D|nr:CBS domain-containing protein [Streptomyces sp. NEAU-S7GS2]